MYCNRSHKSICYRDTSKRAIDQDEFDVEHSIALNLVLDMNKLDCGCLGRIELDKDRKIFNGESYVANCLRRANVKTGINQTADTTHTPPLLSGKRGVVTLANGI